MLTLWPRAGFLYVCYVKFQLSIQANANMGNTSSPKRAKISITEKRCIGTYWSIFGTNAITLFRSRVSLGHPLETIYTRIRFIASTRHDGWLCCFNERNDVSQQNSTSFTVFVSWHSKATQNDCQNRPLVTNRPCWTNLNILLIKMMISNSNDAISPDTTNDCRHQSIVLADKKHHGRSAWLIWLEHQIIML